MNWVTFVGEGRSGHTVLSGALGSHPHVRISEEQKYISKWRRGWSVKKIMSELYSAGPGSTRKKQGWKGLDTHVEPLMLIGDKCGWDAVNEYRKRNAPTSVINDFGTFIGMPVKTIVTARNPADNIANWVQSNKYKRIHPKESDRQHHMIRRYRRFYHGVVDVIQDTDHFVLYHEQFLQDVAGTLESLCAFLELPVEPAWLDRCVKIIRTKPNHRGLQVNWTKESLEHMAWVAQHNSLLNCYCSPMS